MRHFCDSHPPSSGLMDGWIDILMGMSAIALEARMDSLESRGEGEKENTFQLLRKDEAEEPGLFCSPGRMHPKSIQCHIEKSVKAITSSQQPCCCAGLRSHIQCKINKIKRSKYLPLGVLPMASWRQGWVALNLEPVANP